MQREKRKAETEDILAVNVAQRGAIKVFANPLALGKVEPLFGSAFIVISAGAHDTAPY